MTARQRFNILAVVQSGRLQHEAVLLAASLRASDPDFPGKLYLAEPHPARSGPPIPGLPTARPAPLLAELGAEILPFHSRAFGADYPQGNKIEALAALPDEPFLFLDTDTLITDSFAEVAFDFARPSASMRREGTWPQIELYGPGYAATWKSLYDRFGIDFAASLDLSQPDEHWERYLYFNAGWFFHQSPRAFGQRFLDYATAIRDDPPPELVCQTLFPWLDQIALPLVIQSSAGDAPASRSRGSTGP